MRRLSPKNVHLNSFFLAFGGGRGEKSSRPHLGPRPRRRSAVIHPSKTPRPNQPTNQPTNRLYASVFFFSTRLDWGKTALPKCGGRSLPSREAFYRKRPPCGITCYGALRLNYTVLLKKMQQWPERLRLLAILATTSNLLKRSESEGWDLSSPKELKAQIDQIIDSVFFAGDAGLPDHWQTLFAPTGALQEASIANGWPEIFLKLSAEFDSLEHVLRNYEAESGPRD